MAPHRSVPQVPGQHGLTTGQQLLAAGWTRSAVRHALSRHWQQVFPGVIAPHRGPVDGGTRLVAAALWAGPDAVLTGVVGLQRHGLPVRAPAEAVFLVPVTRRSRRLVDVRTLRTSRLPAVVRAEGPVLLTSPARCLLDAVTHQRVGPAEAEHLTIAVLHRGLGTVGQVSQELWKVPAARTRGVTRGLAAYTQGAWSRPEGTLRAVVGGVADLPTMVTNKVLLVRVRDGDGDGDGYGWQVLGIADGYLPEVGVVVQVHSRTHHQGIDDTGGDRWARTVERDSVYAAAGLPVVAVSPWTLYRRPQTFLDRLRRACARMRDRGAPPPVRWRDPVAGEDLGWRGVACG